MHFCPCITNAGPVRLCVLLCSTETRKDKQACHTEVGALSIVIWFVFVLSVWYVIIYGPQIQVSSE